MIYFTSDCHFMHSRQFIYEPRGFNSVEEMDETIIENWNKMVSINDTIYVLGDFFLGQDYDFIDRTLKCLNGDIHLIIGNHDTPKKIDFYSQQPNISEILYAKMITYKKKNFFLCHYPTRTSGLEYSPDRCIINLYGHTHQKEKFYEDRPYMYNVGVDAHNCTPVSIDEIIDDFNEEVKKCISYL